MKTLLISAIVLLQSCSTIFYGRYQEIKINTVPPGAVARIGTQSCLTPCKVTVNRKGLDEVFIRQGDREYAYKLDKTTNFLTYWVGNLFTLYFPGRSVDNITGAEYTIGDVNLILQ